MELRNSFVVPGPPADVFALLLNMERIAPCMPGATLLSSEGNEHRGKVRLKVGPISAAYEGVLTVDEADPSARRAHLTARGREVGGQGTAQAEVVATVEPDGAGSQVVVVTDLQVEGKAAQFGRGVLADVGERIIEQFARNLEATLQDAGAGPGDETSTAPEVTAAAGGELDLWALLGPIVVRRAQRALPALAALLLGVVLGRLLPRSRATPRSASPVWPAWPPPSWPPPTGSPPGRMWGSESPPE